MKFSIAKPLGTIYQRWLCFKPEFTLFSQVSCKFAYGKITNILRVMVGKLVVRLGIVGCWQQTELGISLRVASVIYFTLNDHDDVFDFSTRSFNIQVHINSLKRGKRSILSSPPLSRHI